MLLTKIETWDILQPGNPKVVQNANPFNNCKTVSLDSSRG